MFYIFIFYVFFLLFFTVKRDRVSSLDCLYPVIKNRLKTDEYLFDMNAYRLKAEVQSRFRINHWLSLLCRILQQGHPPDQ